MGVVYRGFDVLRGRECAVKVLDQELAKDASTRSRFLAEARTLMRISHPNVVSVIGVGADGDNYMAMELVSGEPLSQLLARGPLPVPQAVTLAANLAGALGAVHGVGVVHRDIKPDNVMVTPEGALKLIDFGVAREAAETNVLHTQSGALLGTPAYMAPEQVCGKRVDATADTYAFGAVLYEMITGVRAFPANSFAEIVVQHLTLRVPPPSSLVEGVPDALDELLAQCLEKEPEDRPHSMDDIEVLLRQMAVFLEHAPPPPRRLPVVARPRRWWPAVALAAVASVGLVGWSLSRPAPPIEAPQIAAVGEPEPTLAPVPTLPTAPLLQPLVAPSPTRHAAAAHAKTAKHGLKKQSPKDDDRAGLIDAFAN